jgi:RNA polymerase sigma factor for flagellar operon FliA
MQERIEEHLGYAHAVAAEVLRKLPPSVDRDEVESAAHLGLAQAGAAYDPSRGISFATFAYYRIRGAIYDSIRHTVRLSKFEQGANEYMTEYSAAGDAGPEHDLQELRRVTGAVTSSYLLSLEALRQDPHDHSQESPFDSVALAERRASLREAISVLPSKNREVIEGYYYDNASFEEIGRRMGLSKSWICRIHAKSLDMLREVLAEKRSVDEAREIVYTQATSPVSPSITA